MSEYRSNGAGGRPAEGWKGMKKPMIGREKGSTYFGEISR